jgi:hypothetical protein
MAQRAFVSLAMNPLRSIHARTSCERLSDYQILCALERDKITIMEMRVLKLKVIPGRY